MMQALGSIGGLCLEKTAQSTQLVPFLGESPDKLGFVLCNHGENGEPCLCSMLAGREPAGREPRPHQEVSRDCGSTSTERIAVPIWAGTGTTFPLHSSDPAVQIWECCPYRRILRSAADVSRASLVKLVAKSILPRKGAGNPQRRNRWGASRSPGQGFGRPNVNRAEGA